MFLDIQPLSLVLKDFSFGSATISGGSLLYQVTEDQHQLFLVSSSSQCTKEAPQVTPAAFNAAFDDAANLVLCWTLPEATF